MDCRQVAENLLLFRDGRLPPEEVESLRQHLHLCPPCEHLLGGYEELLAVLERLRPAQMSEDCLARIRQRIAEAAAEDDADA